MLDSFFDTLGSAGLDADDSFFDKQIQNKNHGDLDLSWPEELPPQFHGTATSLSHPSLIANASPYTSHAGQLNNLGFGQDTQANATSADVLAAASTLFHNGQAARLGHISDEYIYPSRETGNNSHDIPSSGPSSGRQSIGPYTAQTIPLGLIPDHSPPIPQQHIYQDRRIGLGTVRWGSDASFLDHGFVAPPNQETEEEVTKELMHQMECLEPQTSANTTAPASPTLERQRLRRKSTADVVPLAASNGADELVGQSIESRPKKRRKSKLKHEESDPLESNGNAAPPKGRKGKTTPAFKNGQAGKPATPEASQRQDSPPSGGQKNNRENLTDEQKRSNHILSEQKRRNLIKQGFDDLCELVPELRGGGFSKSAMLVEAADWLEDMLKGNEILRTQLASLQERDYG
ncbi:MAG: hypothetical protein M1819_007442 [Sarea resinae]|nr:MAG: hypothetical protein M1819_007442 [Sarea resinae]